MEPYRYMYIPLKRGARPEADAQARSGNVVGENSGPGGWIVATADGLDPRTCRESDREAEPTEMTRDELMRAGASEENLRAAESIARTWAEYPNVDMGEHPRTLLDGFGQHRP